MTKLFLDTNVLLYANDSRDPIKQSVALERIHEAIKTGTGVISTQVVQEFAAAAVEKLGLQIDVVLHELLLLESLEVVQVTPALVRRSLELRARYGVSFWDAGILAAAEHANCGVLLSEDLNPGQLYAAVRVENPFAS